MDDGILKFFIVWFGSGLLGSLIFFCPNLYFNFRDIKKAHAESEMIHKCGWAKTWRGYVFGLVWRTLIAGLMLSMLGIFMLAMGIISTLMGPSHPYDRIGLYDD